MLTSQTCRRLHEVPKLKQRPVRKPSNQSTVQFHNEVEQHAKTYTKPFGYDVLLYCYAIASDLTPDQ